MGHPLSGLRYRRRGISSTQKVVDEAFAWGKVSGQSSECRDLTMITAPLPPTLVRGNFRDSHKLEDKACHVDASIGKFGSSLYLTDGTACANIGEKQTTGTQRAAQMLKRGS